MIRGPEAVRAPGWYLLTSAEGGPANGFLRLLGVDAAGDFDVPLRTDQDGGLRRVVLLARQSAQLRVVAVGSREPIAFELHPIGKRQALCLMWKGLRHPDGRRDWPLRMRVLFDALGAAARLDPRAMGDAFVAAYVSSARAGCPCALVTGVLARGAFLEPLDGLRRLPGSPAPGSLWEAADDDPKMLLVDRSGHTGLPAGWYLFRLEAECISGRMVAPALYPDYHDDRVPTETIELPDSDSEGRIDALVLFKFPVRRLRFDPTRRQACFRLRAVRLQRVCRLRALFRMLRTRREEQRWSLQGAFGPTRAFLSDWARSGLSMATAVAHERYRRALVQRARDYRQWTRKYDHLGAREIALLAERAGRVGRTTRFSVLVPVYDTPEKYLRACIESVLAQAWPHWELCLVDDASPSPYVRSILSEYAGRDPRIRVEFRQHNGHICEASNDALRMATGDYVALLDHDDLLRPNALLEMAEAIESTPEPALLYSDEDKIDDVGARFDPYFKPDWNPDLLLGQNYLCHLTVVRTDLAREVGGFRPGFEGSQDHDLVLRCTRAIDPSRIRHVSRVLYHWRAIPGSTALHRDAKDYAAEAGHRAVQEHVRTEHPAARVEHLDHGHYRVRWPLPDPPPRVSIIVPTRDRADLLQTCVRSLLETTTYPDFELLLVDNGTVDPNALATLQALGRDPRVKLIRDDSPFNYSVLNNRAAAIASGEVLALVNNDIEVIRPDWLEEMASQALRRGVGAVGAMLLYPDDTIQHAGVILGLGGIANHAYVGEPVGIGGHGGRARVAQSMSAVTGACLVVRRELYLEIGGLDEQLQVAFNDIDFCLRLREAGYRNLWTPFARLYHHESASRGQDTEGEKRERFLSEVASMQSRWGSRLECDPAYNPNLSLSGAGFELADPPRA